MMKIKGLAGLLFVITLLPAGLAAAETFTHCHPDAGKWESISDEQLKNITRQQETKRCEAVNATAEHWQKSMLALGETENTIRSARDRQDWNAVKSAFDSVSPQIDELHTLAAHHATINGAANILALFGGDLNYLFRNARIAAPASTDALTDWISHALTEPETQEKAAGIAQQLVYQSRSRAAGFIPALAQDAGQEAQKEYRVQASQRIEENTGKLKGDTMDGYFGGFLARVSQVYAPVLLFLLIVAVAGAIMSRQARLPPFIASVKAVIAAVVPAAALALLLVFTPFIPAWLLFLIALAGTVAIYSHSKKILGGLASHCGRFPALASGLRWLGGFVSGLDTDNHQQSGGAAPRHSTRTARHVGEPWPKCRKTVTSCRQASFRDSHWRGKSHRLPGSMDGSVIPGMLSPLPRQAAGKVSGR